MMLFAAKVPVHKPIINRFFVTGKLRRKFMSGYSIRHIVYKIQ